MELAVGAVSRAVGTSGVAEPCAAASPATVDSGPGVGVQKTLVVTVEIALAGADQVAVPGRRTVVSKLLGIGVVILEGHHLLNDASLN